MPKEIVGSFPGALAPLCSAGRAAGPGVPGWLRGAGVCSLRRGQELAATAAQLLLLQPLGARPAQPGNQNACGSCLVPACFARTALLRAPVGRWDLLQE